MNYPLSLIHEQIADYISHPCFSNDETIPTLYRRIIAKEKLSECDFLFPIELADISNENNIFIQNLLFTINERDMLFLNENYDYSETKEAYTQFYDPEFVSKGRILKPLLEYLSFDFLNRTIQFPIISTADDLKKYFIHEISNYETSPNPLCDAISNAKDPESAAKQLLIQMAPDFLSEASPLARTVLGSFGKEQSEMMKILIDEYGYGVHHTKHSTLFENLMASVGLNNTMHHYYSQYLTSSLMVINYYHCLTSNKLHWFQYLGALYYTEATIPLFNKKLSLLFKQHFKKCDTHYFDEHTHIDPFHARMVLEKIIIPSIEKYGDKITHEIIIGFESARWILKNADSELISVINAQ